MKVIWSDLIEGLPADLVDRAGKMPVHPPDVSGIVFDSRSVQPGDVFVALSGQNTDGHRYIPDAIGRGAALVVGEKPVDPTPIPYLQVADSRSALAYISAAYYGLPARNLTMLGVTGTDGKTTTANLIYHILLAAGIKAGMITTVNAVIGDRYLDTGFHVTTPEAPDVQNYLSQMVQEGITHVVLEATSHGLAQERVTACEFDIAVVTNITHEHLDYHGSYEAYRDAKARLFTSLEDTVKKRHGNIRLAVLNYDDRLSFEYLHPLVKNELSYGINPRSDLSASELSSDKDGLHFTAVGPGFRLPISTRLVGEYNVYNCLAALAVTVNGLGINEEVAKQGIEGLAAIPGRMERIDLGQDFLAIVDFAHTPNALRVALLAARSLTGEGGRVIAVFGSAGLRDRQKRRMMAAESVELADVTIVTAEDPRTERLKDILQEMSLGAETGGGVEGKDFWRVPDRGEAIKSALRIANKGDVVIVLGKGHEQSMCFGETEYNWDDRIALRAALSEKLNIPGPRMPFLPAQG